MEQKHRPGTQERLGRAGAAGRSGQEGEQDQMQLRDCFCSISPAFSCLVWWPSACPAASAGYSHLAAASPSPSGSESSFPSWLSSASAQFSASQSCFLRVRLRRTEAGFVLGPVTDWRPVGGAETLTAGALAVQSPVAGGTGLQNFAAGTEERAGSKVALSKICLTLHTVTITSAPRFPIIQCSGI